MNNGVHYAMLIRWSDEDQAYLVSFPEFGGRIFTHGDSYEEAAKNGKVMLDLLLGTYQDKGWSLPKPRVYA